MRKTYAELCFPKVDCPSHVSCDKNLVINTAEWVANAH